MEMYFDGYLQLVYWVMEMGCELYTKLNPKDLKIVHLVFTFLMAVNQNR